MGLLAKAMNASKIVEDTGEVGQLGGIAAADLLTAEQLADRLQVPPSWVFEQTRKRASARAKARKDKAPLKAPLPVIRLSPKVLRFHWPTVCAWMQNKE